MEIRSITYGAHLSSLDADGELQHIGAFLTQAREAFREAGFAVQTVRLATQPFPELMQGIPAESHGEAARAFEARCQAAAIDYCSIGPAGLGDDEEWIACIPTILTHTQSLFATAAIATRERGIHFQAIRAAAETILAVARDTSMGFGNLRFAALANCPAGSPFFPVAYHVGEMDSFAIATEAADLAVEAFAGAQSLGEARQVLIARVEEVGSQVAAIAEEISRKGKVNFAGIDFSLAPFPSLERSIGTAFERLGIERFGAHGTLFVAAFITDALEQARFPRCGFSGLMLPVLEDATLALRSQEEDSYTLDNLLAYSAVCGTGLDTVPIPGDLSLSHLAAILLDVAALALRLDKPLTARLMPIPGKQAGDLTNFDFPYFANARILGVSRAGCAALLARGERVGLQPIHRA